MVCRIQPALRTPRQYTCNHSWPADHSLRLRNIDGVTDSMWNRFWSTNLWSVMLYLKYKIHGYEIIINLCNIYLARGLVTSEEISVPKHFPNPHAHNH